MWTSRKSDFKGCWVVAVLLLIVYFVGSNWTFDEYVSHALGVPEDGAPGDAPPFYFLRHDFVRGVCAGAALLLTLVLVALTWKQYQPYSGMALWMAWLWLMPPIVDALIIYWRCPHLMDARRAVSGWNTFHEYLDDPFRRAAYWVTALFAVPLALFLSWRYGRKKCSDAGCATSGGQ
jgi:hypothetical protein